MVQLSHLYMTTGKITALTLQTFVHKVMSLLFNTLSRLVMGEGNGTPLQYCCLENPMDGGAWWAAVHGVAKSQTQLSDFTFTFHFHAWENEMATYSSVLAWRIPWTCQCRRPKRHKLNPWVRKIPWRRKWQSTLVFLPGKSHGQRSLEVSLSWEYW